MTYHPPETDNVLKLQNVTKRFGSVLAVDGVTLSVARSDAITLLGPSGSGKTTILKMIAGFERPSAGNILLEGMDAGPLSPAERRIGFVFQHHALFPHMTVGDNVRYPLKRRKWPKSEHDGRIQQMLALVKLSGYEERYPRQLSGGQRQRVALARALAFRPRFLLMDEPLGALDRALRFELAEEIRRIHRETGATIIYVTHDQEEALTLSDRIAVMRRGRIVQVGTPEDLYERPVESFIAQFLGECNLLPVERWAMEREGRANVTVLGQRFSVPTCGAPQQNDEVALVVRPKQFHINPGTDVIRIQTRVVEMLYLGEMVRMRLRTAAGIEMRSAIDAHRARDVHIGDEAVFGFPPEEVVLVTKTEAPTSQELKERAINT